MQNAAFVKATKDVLGSATYLDYMDVSKDLAEDHVFATDSIKQYVKGYWKLKQDIIQTYQFTHFVRASQCIVNALKEHIGLVSSTAECASSCKISEALSYTCLQRTSRRF